MTPILIILYPQLGIDPSILSHVLFGTNMFVVSFVVLFSAFRYHQRGCVLWRCVFPIAAASFVGALVGTTFAAHLSSDILLRLFGVVSLVASVRMFYKVNVSDDRIPVFNVLALLLTGFVSAMFAVMVGVGGGIITIPVMIFFLRFPVDKVPGTSSGIICFTALAGVMGYVYNGWNDPLIPEHALGYVYLSTGIPLMIGAITGVPLGTWLNSRISTKRIRQLFGILLFVAFIKMTFF